MGVFQQTLGGYMNEADTCRKFVLPKLQSAGWDNEPHSKIESGEVVKSREMYFSIYQALAEDERRTGLFKYTPQIF